VSITGVTLTAAAAATTVYLRAH